MQLWRRHADLCEDPDGACACAQIADVMLLPRARFPGRGSVRYATHWLVGFGDDLESIARVARNVARV